jgi:hypothetical protein
MAVRTVSGEPPAIGKVVPREKGRTGFRIGFKPHLEHRYLYGISGVQPFETEAEADFVLNTIRREVHLLGKPLADAVARFRADRTFKRAIERPGRVVLSIPPPMCGKIKVAGDMQLAMQLALAALSAD